MKPVSFFRSGFSRYCGASLFSLVICAICLSSCAKSEVSNYGTWYEIFTASFYDSDADGMGDLAGITAKLDYLNDRKRNSETSLHVDGLWLMPIMPSPTYHKYDVTDYRNIDPDYGTLEDFDKLIAECDKRGIKVIIDLVMNHTSSRHPWFLQAVEELRSGTPGKYAAYYNFAENNTGWRRLGVGDWYYEGGFTGDMPDLNHDNPDVRAEFEAIADFWLARGVAGFRLDAIRHLYPNLAKSVEATEWFISYCKSKKPDVYIVGEVWSTDSDTVAFYASGIPSAFNFRFAGTNGSIAKAVRQGAGEFVVDEILRWDLFIKKQNPQAIDAPFISNHDTDRSAGYFERQKDPLAAEKTAASVYLFMPGNPFIYYGEELGIKGRGRDENKRSPFIWSVHSTEGLTRGPSAMDRNSPDRELDEGAAEQLADPASLLRHYIAVQNLKSRYKTLVCQGTTAKLKAHDSVAAYTQTFDGKTIAIVHNLSGKPRNVPLANARKIGGFVSAQDIVAQTAADGSPVLSGGELTVPPLTLVVVEMAN